MDKLLLIIEYVLIIVGFIVLLKKPSLRRYTIMLCILALVLIAQNVYAANAAGLGVRDYLMQSFNTALEEAQKTNTALQPDQTRFVAGIFTTVWVGMKFFQASFFMLVALLVARFFGKLKNTTDKVSCLSKLDLKIWTVYPLIAGVVLFAVSAIPAVPERETLFVIAMNVLVISTLPLFVQGFAAYKGIMNNMGIRFGSQFLISLILFFLGIMWILVPGLGLIDYWANFRKLDRSGSNSSKKPDLSQPAKDDKKAKSKQNSNNKKDQALPKPVAENKVKNDNKIDEVNDDSKEDKLHENHDGATNKEAPSASKDVKD